MDISAGLQPVYSEEQGDVIGLILVSCADGTYQELLDSIETKGLKVCEKIIYQGWLTYLMKFKKSDFVFRHRSPPTCPTPRTICFLKGRDDEEIRTLN